jgi:hypothetical protein
VASPDVILVFHGSIALTTPLTEPATIWVRQHLDTRKASIGVAPSLSSLATWARSSPARLMTVW